VECVKKRRQCCTKTNKMWTSHGREPEIHQGASLGAKGNQNGVAAHASRMLGADSPSKRWLHMNPGAQPTGRFDLG
jgi:hypothetical protein